MNKGQVNLTSIHQKHIAWVAFKDIGVWIGITCVITSPDKHDPYVATGAIRATQDQRST